MYFRLVVSLAARAARPARPGASLARSRVVVVVRACPSVHAQTLVVILPRGRELPAVGVTIPEHPVHRAVSVPDGGVDDVLRLQHRDRRGEIALANQRGRDALRDAQRARVVASLDEQRGLVERLDGAVEVVLLELSFSLGELPRRGSVGIARVLLLFVLLHHRAQLRVRVCALVGSHRTQQHRAGGGGRVVDGAALCPPVRAAVDVAKQVLIGADYANKDLVGATFNLSNLREADLSGSDLRGASLYGAKLQDADLSDTDLREATLDSAVMTGTNLSNAVMEGAFAFNTRFKDVVITGADFTDVPMRPDQLKSLCSVADGTNPVTGRSTRESLGCS